VPRDRDLHRLCHQMIVVLFDPDAEPAVRVEAADFLLRNVVKEKRKIDEHTRQSIRAGLARALTATRAELIRAQRRKVTEGHA